MKLAMFAGPMWAGKTTKLLEGLTPDQFLCVTHPIDTRKSKRDLSFLFPDHCMCPDEFYRLREFPEVLLVDEVHFWEVSREYDLQSVLWSAYMHKVGEVRLAGIFHDCYNQFLPFALWRELHEYACKRGWESEFRLLYSLLPCALCGAVNGNFFSVPSPVNLARVGDDYITICAQCAQTWRLGRQPPPGLWP